MTRGHVSSLLICSFLYTECYSIIRGEPREDYIQATRCSREATVFQCDIVFTENLETCQYHNAVFSPGLDYFILECLGPSIPTVALYKTALPEPRFIGLLQNNTALRVSD